MTAESATHIARVKGRRTQPGIRDRARYDGCIGVVQHLHKNHVLAFWGTPMRHYFMSPALRSLTVPIALLPSCMHPPTPTTALVTTAGLTHGLLPPT